MKKILVILMLFYTVTYAEPTWQYERINMNFENDIFSGTDSEYTDGLQISALMYRPYATNKWLNIPFLHQSDRAHFISFSLTQQMFTPADLNASEPVPGDRPYAGYVYFEMGLHQSSNSDLDSLVFQLGIIGPASGMEGLQKFVHENIGSDIPQGWDNQLSNEVTLQINYQHKWRYVPQPVLGVESSFIPFVGAELGNVAVKANTGALFRFGWHIPQDFGVTAVGEGGENGIPVKSGCLCKEDVPWSFNFHLAAGATAVARDIFLDGSTFTSSYSVSKEPFKGFASGGFSARYKNYSFDYIHTFHTKQFKEGVVTHSVGSFILSYLF